MARNLLSWIQGVWSRLTANLYVQSLELEITRLRLENRALMNSILGIAGVPPVITPVVPDKYGRTQPSGQSSDRIVEGTAKTRVSRGPAVMPLRKRSWQQVHKAWEIQAAAKKTDGGGEIS